MSGILTYTGKVIDPFNVKPNDICIEDIAHGLSLLCRFNGQCTRFYSVAEHSIIMATYPKFKQKCRPLALLLHDATEAYLGDIISPIKKILPVFKQLEKEFMFAIAIKFGLVFPRMFAEVKKADIIMLATEAYRWMNGDINVSSKLVDLEIPDFLLTPKQAEHRFLRVYKELRMQNGS